MKLKNVSVKVIGVLGHDMMPDETMECTDAVVENSAVQTLLKMNLLQLDDSEEKEAAMKAAALAEARAQLEAEAAAKAEAADNAAPAEAPKSRRAKTEK